MESPIPKEQLLAKLLDGVKGCQSRFGSRTELATEDEESVRKLCLAYENVFLHGFKVPEKGKSLWQMTENLVPGLRLPLENPSFWPLIKSQLSKHEAERFLLLHNVRSDYGRGRAWLRAALNEHSLERSIFLLLSLQELPHFYEAWAFLQDPELAGILPQTAAGLGSVLFALVVDNPLLDCWVRPTISKEDAVASPVEVAEVADQFLAALKKDQEESSYAKDAHHQHHQNTPNPSQKHSNLAINNKKKKKRPHVNVVSFDEDNQNEPTSSSNTLSSSSKSHNKNMSASSPQQSSNDTSATTTPTPTQTPTPTPTSLSSNNYSKPFPSPMMDVDLIDARIISSSSASASVTLPVQISASTTRSQLPVTNCNNFIEESSSSLPIYSSSVKSADCISVNSIYSDCSERLELDNNVLLSAGTGGGNNDLNFGRISPSQRLIPVRDGASASRASAGRPGNNNLYNNDDNDGADDDSGDLNLIPVPNFDHENERIQTATVAPELQIDLDLSSTTLDQDDDDTTSPKSLVTTPCTANTSTSEPILNLLTTLTKSGSGRSSSSISKNMNSTTSNMIDARISSCGGGDEERIVKLKAILDREIETVANLQALLAEEKRRSRDQVKILEARVESLGKDNEILKHQLNKYIGAVQLLKKERQGRGGLGRRGSSFEGDEEIDELLLNQQGGNNEGNANDSSRTQPIADEGAEYERKLIQVAEMHGELMEFNAHLQTSLRRRDLAIRRLKEELVDLRGPLSAPFLSDQPGGGGGGGGELDDGSWDIVDSTSAHSGSLGGSTGSGGLLGHPTRRQIHLTHNERVLINIWIPSAFLTGANTDLHHVYQVFLRIKDTEWNVYRRYSQFYSLHRDLKKRDSVIGSFYFPPKKHLGNKDGKFVDERRRKLQDYLRKVINHTLQGNSILAAHPDKNLLISIFPFFGENTFVNQKKKEKSRGRLFFRPNTSSGSSQVHNSPSGFQTQSQQYPQYTGL